MDVSTLIARDLRDFSRYLEATDLEYIDFFPPTQLDFRAWKERENPCDPDVDA